MKKLLSITILCLLGFSSFPQDTLTLKKSEKHFIMEWTHDDEYFVRVWPLEGLTVEINYPLCDECDPAEILKINGRPIYPELNLDKRQLMKIPLILGKEGKNERIIKIPLS